MTSRKERRKERSEVAKWGDMDRRQVFVGCDDTRLTVPLLVQEGDEARWMCGMDAVTFGRWFWAYKLKCPALVSHEMTVHHSVGSDLGL